MLHRRSLVATGSLLVVAAFAAFAGTARAERTYVCPPHQTFSMTQGACVKATPPAPPRSPQKKYQDAVAAISNNPGSPGAKASVAILDDNCARANHAPSCTTLGFLYSRGREVKTDPARAMALFVRACGMTDVEGCFNLADLTERQSRYPEARTAYVHACDVGSGLGCVRGGDLYRQEQVGTKPDPATSAALYKRGYALFQPQCPNDGGACYALGYLYENGYGVAKDPAAALAAYRNACKGGSGDGCEALGTALYAGLGGPPDPAGGNEAYTTGCESDDNADACQKVAERLGKANQDLPHALLLATRACLLDPQNCGTVAEFYRLGLGTTADQDTATSFYKTACEAGAPRWCTSWAERAHKGIGMPVDLDAGIAVSEQACKAGDPEGCRQGAGYLVVKDPARALDLANKGCEQNDAESCYLAGSYQGAAKHFDLALQLYERACGANHAQACVDGAAAYTAGSGTAANPAKAQELTQKACVINDASVSGGACQDLVQLTYFGTPKDAETAMYAAARACALGKTDPCDWLGQLSLEVPGDHADLREYLATNCAAGTDGACLAQAQLLLRGSEADKKAGLDVLDAACARKSDRACIAKGNALYNGVGTLPQKDKAEAIFDEYCTKNDAQACTNMSIISDDKKAFDKAFVYAKRACELGSADGCQNTGYFYFAAKGTRWDPAEGVKQWQKACELHSSYGCWNLGYMLRYGIELPKDAKKALAAYEQGCTPTEQIGCQGAAHYYETGEGGTTVDAKKAIDAYRSACDSQSDPQPDACSDLAAMMERRHEGTAPQISALRVKALGIAQDKATNNAYKAWILGTYYRDGVATMKDPAKAREWFAKSCEGYDPLGCLDGGKALLATGVPADAERARSEYLERACTVGLIEACDLKAGKGKATTPGGNVKAKGCGCQGGSDGGWIFALGVAALVLRRRRRC